jgi:hypothetical protein
MLLGLFSKLLVAILKTISSMFFFGQFCDVIKVMIDLGKFSQI